MSDDQLHLFGPPSGAAPAGRGASPERREPDAETTRQAAALAAAPAPVRLGTSSWSFPGWRGIVWADGPGAPRPSKTRLAREGLREYARHPLLGAVGLDRTYYRPEEAGGLRALAAQVPDDFRFLVKAHEDLVVGRFPRHPRYRGREGEANPRFLDAAYAIDRVVGPTVEGLGAKLGVLLFQLPPQGDRDLGGPAGFAERLHAFLEALPRGVPYAVEIRKPSWLTPAYARALAEGGAVHCATVHPTMPGIGEQLRRAAAPPPDADPGLVIRWMLGHGQEYGEAKSRYAPFDALVDPDPGRRDEIAAACAVAARAGRPALVVINNKAEGSAPLSAFALAERIADRLG